MDRSFGSDEYIRGTLDFCVEIKQAPEPHVEHILCDTAVLWETQKGNFSPTDELYTTLTITEDEDWGCLFEISAAYTWFEIPEPPHPSPPGHGDDHSACAIACAGHAIVTPKIELKEIHFNHIKDGFLTDGFNLRKNYLEPIIEAPEWTPSTSKEVAYCSQITPTIKTKFSLSPSILDHAKIKAVNTTENSVIGNFSSTNISFPEGSEIFTASKIIPKKIKNELISLQWTVESFQDISIKGWDNFAHSKNNCFVTFSIPQSPWKQSLGLYYPWVDALNYAINTCETNGLSSEEESMKVLTTHLYKKKYTDNSIYASDTMYATFRYTDYMKNNLANCIDSSGGLAITARILGLNAKSIYHHYIALYNFHCYVMYNEKVYDSCSGMNKLVEGWTLQKYLE